MLDYKCAYLSFILPQLAKKICGSSVPNIYKNHNVILKCTQQPYTFQSFRTPQAENSWTAACGIKEMHSKTPREQFWEAE